MIATESIIVKKKLKIKFGGKRLEADPQTCKFEQPASLTGEWKCAAGNETGQNERVGKISAVNGSKLRISLPISNKRGPPEPLESPKKRLKIDRAVTQQCTSLLKKLMHHQCGWPFNRPVDPVALNIPDYFSIISKPMDLGTVKSRLEKKLYLGIEEFATDVRLTFSNAMHYNPPGNEVHIMADRLSKIFESGWKVLEAKWNRGTPRGELISSDKQLKDGNAVGHSDSKTAPPADLCKNGVANGEIKCQNDAGVTKVKVPKVPQSKPSTNNINKGTDSDSSLAFRSKCDVCASISCPCSHSQISDSLRIVPSGLPSERSQGQDHACHGDGSGQAKNHRASHWDKSDQDNSDEGAGSAVDEEDFCTTGGAAAANTDATCGEGWAAPLPDVQLSPKKALRAAMLKSRFAATILKAQHKTLLDHGDKADPIKLQQEKERLERRQLEEKARIEAQIKAAEARAEAELKKQRERDREAARIALQKMEKTVEIGENLEILKELEILSGCSLSVHVPESDDGSEVLSGGFDGSPGKNALERLGLFMKDDYMEDDDEETVCNGGEEGEIFS
ncbi:hypothetical protein CDL15_Pgr027383 [Punica granatum]|uniref:Bromo domain-containing protein n=1 Tax=Punica granatum TaxID=22663 RepID=A0A218Y1Y7_PUNGR|nr:hypothetical protein CDL15_Pgr027383 [Punica granatum]PKI40849.1 hypothetical protein CRG98_038756 [Punica granatum]